jgi:ssDNA-binding Zn-finger/Zn-ribbon topoisomerase 1
MVQIYKVNWVRCPKCNFRFYVGPQLLTVKEALAYCPKCHSEFKAEPNLDSKLV